MKDKNEDENENENEDEDKDEIIKILMSSYEDYDDDKINNKIKKLNKHLDKIIDKSKPFENQIKSIKSSRKYRWLLSYERFDGKKLKFKTFKLKLACLSNKIDESLFEQIFNHKIKTLANKLINTIKKEKKSNYCWKYWKKNKDELFKTDKYGDWVIKPNDKRINLKDAIDLIVDFNEELN